MNVIITFDSHYSLKTNRAWLSFVFILCYVEIKRVKVLYLMAILDLITLSSDGNTLHQFYT